MKQNFLLAVALLLGNCLIAQNVGIGINNPSFPLDVKSTGPAITRFDGGNYMYISLFENNVYRGYIGSYAGAAEDVDFGTGSGNNTGKLHLTTQAVPRLTVAANGNVGIGDLTPSRKLDVNGSLGINGAMYLSGQPGTEGQVMVSNGAGVGPEWRSVTTANDTRFGIAFQKVGATSTLDLNTTYYNLNPANVTLNASSITIQKTGLYRLNGNIAGLVQGSFTDSPEMTCDLNFSGNLAFQYDIMQWKPMLKRTAINNNYYTNESFELEIYIPAPTTLTFAMSFLASSSPSYQEKNLRVFAYLISE